MAENTVKKTTEKATIDCAMVVIKTREAVPVTYGFKSGTKVGVEANIETQEAVKLIVKGVLIAQKPEKKTLTGHTLTITDSLLIMELLPLCNGGELTKDEQQNITGYNAPKVGEEVKKTKFDVTTYSAIMEGSDVVGYEACTYPNCEGQPLGLGGEDDVFRTQELSIVSAPGSGESAMTMKIVTELPGFEA